MAPSKLRHLLRRYRFEDFPPETQEAIVQVRDYESSRMDAEKNGPVVSKGIKGRRYELYESQRYIRDRGYLEKDGYDLADPDYVVAVLLDGERLPRRYKVHEPKGDTDGLWDCHVKDDWILLYRYGSDGLVLEAVRTGCHRDILGIRPCKPLTHP